jgi:general secretion pathway protein A
MYEAFFHLKGKPFELLPDPDYLYMSPAHRKAITYLDYGIKERAGFILLTGEVGSGKTTIIKNIINCLETNVTTSKIFTTSVTSHQLLSLINEDFGLESVGKDKVALFKDLNDFLIKEFMGGRHCLLLIDEAQNLSAECLEEVRMLSNLETQSSKLLQIILVGQPELRRTLAANDMRQLRQRISINCHIPPLDRTQTESYILHRLECAGNRNALTFTPGCFDIIQHHTRGIPRLINIMSDFLLLSAFVDGSNALSDEIVREIAADLQFDRNYWSAVDDLQRSVCETVQGSDRNEELQHLMDGLQGRLGVLEKASAAFVQLDELSAIEQRCGAMEETVNELRHLIASDQISAPYAISPATVTHDADDFRLVSPESLFPGDVARKGFFRSLFGRF